MIDFQKKILLLKLRNENQKNPPVLPPTLVGCLLSFWDTENSSE